MMHSGKLHGFFVPLFDDADAPVQDAPSQRISQHGDLDAAENASRHRLKLLILGGYGTFGGRLAELLCEEPSLSLIIAGRSQAKAAALCARLAPGAARQAIAIDRNSDLGMCLREHKPDILIDVSGPFQNYGDDPYRVVRAAIAAGVHYLDLSDASAFVRGITQFDDAAREQGIAVLSGVSSFPVLTAAVVRQLSRGLSNVDSIAGGIAPSPYAGYGRNVIRAIAGYAGKPVRLRRDGRDTHAWGLTEVQRYTIAPPGLVPLDPRDFSLVDVPDLQLLTDLWPQVRNVWMGAGPVPGVLHRMLRWLAASVARGWIPSLAPLSSLFYIAVNTLRWGEDRGGMFVEVEGTDKNGVKEVRSWHLLAEGKGGPYIPSMAVAAIVRKWLAGFCPMPGARAAAQDVELDDYRPFFRNRKISFGTRNDADDSSQSVFRRLLGNAYDSLPSSLKAVHGDENHLSLRGRATVTRSRNLPARCIAAIIGLPQAGSDVPVTVKFEQTSAGEKWTREFDGHVFSSTLFEGRGRCERLLCERFGPFVFAMAPVVEGSRLRLQMRRCTLLGVPLPRFLAPRGSVYEEERDGRFCFHVEIRLPIIGRIVCYEGWLNSEQ